MPLRITGHQLVVTDKIRKYIEKKIPRVEKYSDRPQNIEVLLAKDGFNHTAEIKVKDGAVSVTAKTKDPDLLTALDALIDKVERQITKKRQKMRGLQTKRKGEASARKREGAAEDLFPLEEEEQGGRWPAKTDARAGTKRKGGKEKRKGAERPKEAPRSTPVFVEKLGIRLFSLEDEEMDTMTLEAAAEELFFKDENFLCFVNADTERMSVIYRRKDGNFGVFEPATP